MVQDYLLSNSYVFDTPAMRSKLASMKPEQATLYSPAMEARASYVIAGLNEVRKDYGSMENYVTKGLGVSPDTVSKLRARLLT